MPARLRAAAPLLLALTAIGGAPRSVAAQDLTETRRVEVARRLAESSVSIRVGPSGGSGVLVGDRGWVISNSHVVRQGRRHPIELRFGSGARLEGRLLADDPRHDLAVIEPVGRVEARPLPLGDSDRVEVGQSVLAYGSPFGLEGTLTQGIVSARRDLPGLDGVRGLIQTDAPINPGNSGGPLVNGRGELVGINTAILSRTGGSNGIGFAVPSSYVRELLARVGQELDERRRLAEQGGRSAPGGPAERPTATPPRAPDAGDAALGVTTPVWLGIWGDDVQAGRRLGVRIRQVVPDGPASRAGLRGAADPAPASVRRLGVPWTGHIILAMDGQPVRSMSELQQLLGRRQAGERAVLTLTVGPGAVVGEAVVELAAPPRARGARVPRTRDRHPDP